MIESIAERAEQMCGILYNKKAQDIVSIYIGDKSIVADYFIVASGRNSQLVKALCDELEEKLAAEQFFAKRKEGYTDARWIVLDFGDILVHIFHPDERKYYNLERLWVDGDNIRNYSDEMDAKAEQE